MMIAPIAMSISPSARRFSLMDPRLLLLVADDVQTFDQRLEDPCARLPRLIFLP
jgi:hypothetical protein